MPGSPCLASDSGKTDSFGNSSAAGTGYGISITKASYNHEPICLRRSTPIMQVNACHAVCLLVMDEGTAIGRSVRRRGKDCQEGDFGLGELRRKSRKRGCVSSRRRALD